MVVLSETRVAYGGWNCRPEMVEALQMPQPPQPPLGAPLPTRPERKRKRLEDDMDWDPAGSPPPGSDGGDEWKPSRADRAANRHRAAIDAANLSTNVPQVTFRRYT